MEELCPIHRYEDKADEAVFAKLVSAQGRDEGKNEERLEGGRKRLSLLNLRPTSLPKAEKVKSNCKRRLSCFERKLSIDFAVDKNESIPIENSLKSHKLAGEQQGQDECKMEEADDKNLSHLNLGPLPKAGKVSVNCDNRRLSCFERRGSTDILAEENGSSLATSISSSIEKPLKVYRRRRSRMYSSKDQLFSSCDALKNAVTNLYNLNDFDMEKIGEGFFSEVFKVIHKTTGSVMVLKLNKHRANRLSMLKEVQLMKNLSHPNVLKYEAACVHEGQLHALTEYVDGGSLEQLIQNSQYDFPWPSRISLAQDVAKGIQYLHSKGYFHRDLTSKNVLIRNGSSPRPNGKRRAVVADFGLAAPIPDPENFNGRLPQVGTPYWMSPECLRGCFYDHTSDIFSFGIILCEIISRLEADPDLLPRTPVFGVDYEAFAELIQDSECPAMFLKTALNCVKIDPKDRPKMGSVVDDLGAIISNKKRKTISNPGKKASIHVRKSTFSNREKLLQIARESARSDPHYKSTAKPTNPFSDLPRRLKLIEDMNSNELFCSCFEMLVSENGENDGGKDDAEQLTANVPIRKAVSLIHREASSTSSNGSNFHNFAFNEEIIAALTVQK